MIDVNKDEYKTARATSCAEFPGGRSDLAKVHTSGSRPLGANVAYTTTSVSGSENELFESKLNAHRGFGGKSAPPEIATRPAGNLWAHLRYTASRNKYPPPPYQAAAM